MGDQRDPAVFAGMATGICRGTRVQRHRAVVQPRLLEPYDHTLGTHRVADPSAHVALHPPAPPTPIWEVPIFLDGHPVDFVPTHDDLPRLDPGTGSANTTYAGKIHGLLGHTETSAWNIPIYKWIQVNELIDINNPS